MRVDADVVVIGGGPAGSATAMYAARAGFSVCLVERHTFPRETLCGEFLSHEVVGVLRDLGLERGFLSLAPVPIRRFTFCPNRGPRVTAHLDFPAYGMRRSTFDRMLLEEAGSRGVSILQPATVWSITRRTDGFDTHCTTPRGEQTIRSRWAVGAFGKSSPLEKHLRRPFAGIRTGLNGVKFHLPSPALAETGTDEILICHGPNGYCGINHVNGGLATICFLERHAHAERGARGWVLDLTGDNPAFARIMTPEALDAVAHAPVHGGGNIFFGKRSLVEQGIFMVGDAARVIAPLAGDGIGMALQGAQLLGRSFERDRRVSSGPGAWESRYRREWQEMFRRRMWTALVLQRTLLSAPLRRVVSSALAMAPSLVRPALTMTRG